MGSFLPFIQHLKEICRLHSETNTVANFSASDKSHDTDNRQILQSSKNSGKIFQVPNGEDRVAKDKQGLAKCKICDEHIKKEDLMKHQAAVHKDIGEKWKCELCNKLNYSEWKLMKHINYYHLNKENRDNGCPRTIHNTGTHEKVQQATQSGKEKSEDNFKCLECDKVFATRILYKRHLRSYVHTGVIKQQNSFVCLKCDKAFDNWRRCQRHLKTNLHKGLITCTVCLKHYKKDEWLKHQSEHKNNAGQWKCEVCAKYFKSINALDKHKKSLHTFECKICKLTFNSEDEHKSHRLSHQTFQCSDCDYKTYSKYLLKCHITHNHMYKSSCYHCYKNFESSKLLKKHLLTHRCECTACGKSFVSSKKWKAHFKRVHVGKKVERKERPQRKRKIISS